MSAIGIILEALKTALQAAAPARVVTRELRDFGDRSEVDLKQGIYTLISRGQQEMRSRREYLRVLLVGQVMVDEKAAGDALEEAELLMIDELRRFKDGVQGAQVNIASWQQSQQIERPHGWISAELEVGPFDFSTAADPATLGDFITFKADYVEDGQTLASDEVTLPAP